MNRFFVFVPHVSFDVSKGGLENLQFDAQENLENRKKK